MRRQPREPDTVNAPVTADDDRAELGALAVLCSLPHMGPARLRAVLDGRDALGAVCLLRKGGAAALAALRTCRGVGAPLIATWRRQVAAAYEEAATGGRCLGAGLLDAHEQAGIWLWVPTRAGAAAIGAAEGEAAAIGAVDIWESDPEPPALLFGEGAAIDPALRRVGIVGTRRCTAYGRTVARQLGASLAAAGVAVVSGLATGIDGIAQRAALDAGGLVIGVVGSGLDQVYPASNRALWADVARHGTLLSEYPLGRRAAPWQFPARNRIVAALCEVLVVVESGPTGGSMYTVDAAAERDRPVMAVPGPITSVASVGTNRLLSEGCAPVCDVDDILAALGEPAGAHGSAASPAPPSCELDRQVLDELTAGPRTLDELTLRTGAGLAELASALGRLQLAGWAAETGGWWEKAR